MNFATVAKRHKWAPGALEMAAAKHDSDPAVRRVYAMLACELVMPLHVGERKHQPVKSTIKRRARKLRNREQMNREASARRRIEEMRESRAIFDAHGGWD